MDKCIYRSSLYSIILLLNYVERFGTVYAQKYLHFDLSFFSYATVNNKEKQRYLV